MEELYIDQTIYHKRPEKNSRIEKEERVYDLLDTLGIEYERIDHGVTATIESCEKVEEVLNIEISKNLFLCTANRSQYYLLIMPGNKKFKTGDFSKQIQSSRLSFAKAEDMEQYLDITPGSVSILGLMNDHENKVQLLIDEDVLKQEYIGCHPCINTSSLKIRTEDVLNKILPAIHHQPRFVTQ